MPSGVTQLKLLTLRRPRGVFDKFQTSQPSPSNVWRSPVLKEFSPHRMRWAVAGPRVGEQRADVRCRRVYIP